MFELSQAVPDRGLNDRPEAEDRFLLWPEVRHQTGMSRTTAWRMERAGTFPARVQLSPGRVGWRESEVADWKRSRRLAKLAAVLRCPGRSRASVHPVETAVSQPAASRPGAGPVPLPEAADRPPKVEFAGSIVAPPAAPRARRGSKIAAGQLGFNF